MKMEKIVEVQNVTKIYGKNNEKKTQALSGISFTVEKGEFIGIMGASGSGKSTLLNILSTLDKPTDGNIRINQNDVKSIWIYSPENHYVQEYCNWVQPIFTVILKNCYQNMKLAQLRDAILPKFMSGEIDVSDIAV